MLNSISTYSPNFGAKTKFMGAVSNTYDNALDAYDKISEKKDNYIAANIAKHTNTNKRASATVIGAATGLINALLFLGAYALVKKKPKLNNKIFNEWFVKGIDKWMERGKELYPTSSKFKQKFMSVYMKVIYSTLTGAAAGFGWSLYRTLKNTNVNGKISHTRSGAQGRWVAEGLEKLSKTEEGKNIIRNSVTKNSDNSYTVRFNGIDSEYVITKKELKQAGKIYLTQLNENGETKTFKRKYSKGDGDVIAFELAVEKYCKDILSGNKKANPNIPLSVSIVSEQGDILNTGGSTEGLYYLLTGKSQLPSI